MQIDSHMRADPDWDTGLIGELHSCDEGESSVLTIYPSRFEYLILDGEEVEALNASTQAMRWYGTTTDKMPVCGGTSIERNHDWLIRPFEAAGLSGGFIFSHGHFILNAGYSKHLNNVF